VNAELKLRRKRLSRNRSSIIRGFGCDG